MMNSPGGTGNDSLTGTSGADLIEAYGGNDTIIAGSGNDTIYGGDGNDRIDYGDGSNWVYGGAGDDNIYDAGHHEFAMPDFVDAGSGQDTVSSGGGNDTIFGGGGRDSLAGDAGDDLMHGDADNDTLDGGEGNDTIYGGDGRDSLAGDAGDDLMHGDADNDTLDGGEGNDRIFGGTGADSLIGGSGTDTADYSNSGAGVTVDLATGTGAGGDAAGDTLSGIENLTGSAFADNLTGSSSSGSLSGGDGADTINAGAGNDTVHGDAGNDMLYGGSGNDSILGGTGDDVLDGGADQDTLSGGTGNDTLAGAAGNDSLSGGDGNDSLTGGTGTDTLSGGAGHDVYELSPSGGADLISDFSMVLGGNLTQDQLDVSDLTNADGSPVKSFDVVVSNDGGGNALLTFPGGETLVLQGVSPATVASPGMLAQMGVPCFAGGTLLMTPQGERPVEDLGPGDLVALAGGGVAPVLWHGQRSLAARDLTNLPHLRPIRLKSGHFGLSRDLVVSPQHGILVGGALVRARHLAALGKGAHVARGIRAVTYHHLLLPCHALILSHGAASESFYPGPQAQAALAPPDRLALTAALGLGRHATPLDIQTAYGPRCLPLRPWRGVAGCPAALPVPTG